MESINMSSKNIRIEKFLLLVLVCLLSLFMGAAYADSERIQNPANGRWYQRFDNTMSWHSAKAYCEGLGGYLAAITSKEEDNFVFSNVCSDSTQFCWIGATDEAIEGDWKWVTDEPWEYTNWGEGEPNNCNDIEHYLMYLTLPDPRPGFWNDLGSLNNGGCGCGCPSEFYSMSIICEWEEDVPTNRSCQGGRSHIRGRIATAEDTAGLEEVMVTVTGPSACQETTTTKDLGFYLFPHLREGIYTVTPDATECTFDPPSRTVTLEEGPARLNFEADCP